MKTASIGKAYKNLVMRLNPDKNHKHNLDTKHHFDETSKGTNDRKQDEKSSEDSTPRVKGGFYKRSIDDNFFVRSQSSALSRTSSRRSHTPTPSLERSSSRSSSNMMNTLRRTLSKKRASSSSTHFEIPNVSLAKMMSQNDKNASSNIHNSNNNNNNISTPKKNSSNEGSSRSRSRRSTTPIIFSHSTKKMKPQPIERKLECTLEELCFGAVKKIMIFRDIISDVGIITQEEEILHIEVKAGWKKGTTVTFEGKGDEKPGFLAADIIFLIEEKQHPAYKRIGKYDLELGIEVPLLKALVGFSISLPLLGGEKTTLKIDEIIYPGYVKLVPDQGMRKGVDDEERGDLRLKFIIVFPLELTQAQRSNISNVLQDCF